MYKHTLVIVQCYTVSIQALRVNSEESCEAPAAADSLLSTGLSTGLHTGNYLLP